MRFEDLPRNWFLRQNYKLFAMNVRENNIPNLWCLCLTHLNPIIIQIDDQHVSFSISDNGKELAMAAIYASTCYLKRRQLWNTLGNLLNQFSLPWNFIGNFNTILGAYEHQGNYTPSRTPMQDFQTWIDTYDLLHLPTKGALFTWKNGREGRRFTQRRLDRSICNQDWLDVCSTTSCLTLIRLTSYHYPLLLEVKTTEVLFTSSFKFLKMWISKSFQRSLLTG